MQLRDRNKDLIFVAGGSGMAPIKSLVEEVFSETFEKEAWFFYGARAKKDLYLTEEWTEISRKTSKLPLCSGLIPAGCRR